MMAADPKKPGTLTLVFDETRDIDITRDLQNNEEIATLTRLSITFHGKLPSGSLPRSDGTPSFTRWCMDHSVTFVEWKQNAAKVMIEAKRIEIFECLIRSDFDVDVVIPEEVWMAVVERDEYGITSAISVNSYMEP